jgi:hypothetical protein
LLTNSKCVTSAQISYELGITLRSAWFMIHRIREAVWLVGDSREQEDARRWFNIRTMIQMVEQVRRGQSEGGRRDKGKCHHRPLSLREFSVEQALDRLLAARPKERSE